MDRSQRLRLKDQREIHRLLMECRDLGHDPAAWRRHMFARLRWLTDAKLGIGGEACGFGGPGHEIVQTVADGYENDFERRNAERYVAEGGMPRDPVFRAFLRLPGRIVTRRLEQLVDPAEWHASEIFQRYMRPARLDARIISFCRTPSDGRLVNAITLHRSPGQPPFSRRDSRLVHLFHIELARLIGRTIATVTTAAEQGLPPRLRQVLRRLLAGDGEKQVAQHLGISRHTVHTYVNRLHRRFDVQSRGELLARCRCLAGLGG